MKRKAITPGTAEAKPCPFCGRKPQLRRNYTDEGVSVALMCVSKACMASVCVGAPDRANAVEIWNTRKGEQ